MNPVFTTKNYVLFGVSIVLLFVGYHLLGQGPADNPLSKSVAPVLLVFVYCALIPYAIMARSKSSEERTEQGKKSGV